MKLKKSMLLQATNERLSELGYKQIKDTVTAANGLFIKQIQKKYFLSLGFTISNFYHSKFTAAYYLSKTTRWGSLWGDIPQESYQRIGQFLTLEERRLYLDDEYNNPGVIDSWWNGDIEGVRKFLKVVEITESRFLEQKNLIAKIDNSTDIDELVDYSSLMFILLETPTDNTSYNFIPDNNVDDIPAHLFKLAERVLIEKKGILNKNTVKALAADVWHQLQITR